MSPDVIEGYLQAGRSLSPWIDNAVWFVWWTAPGVVLIGLILAAWCGLGALHHGIRRLRTRCTGGKRLSRADRARAERILRITPPRETPAPGTDLDLLIDAARAYYGPANQPRKEKP